MDFHAFAAKVKEKYPEYADVPDSTLAARVIAKYSEYRDSIDPQDLIALDNLNSLNGQGPVNELMGAAEIAGKPVKAGIAGVADIAAGEGLQQAATDVAKVQAGEAPETTAGKVGKFVGSLATPGQIALQGGLGAVAEALGPAVAETMQGWAGTAANAAVGKIKSLATALGVKNLPGLGQFLLAPIKVGEKELPAIIEATSSPATMLEAAKAAKQAAGAQLGVVSDAVDAAIEQAVGKGAEAPVAIDLAGLQKSVAELKAAVEDVAPNLGKAVVNQYENAIQDLNKLVKEAIAGDSKTVFSDLSKLKTTIGDLVYRHGSPLESKAALNDVYHVISDTLESAASKVGGEVGPAYAQANDVYHKLSAVVEGLEGRTISASKLFDAPAFLAALSTGLATHGPLAAVTTPLAYGATRLAQNYGPQAIAKGLNVAAPVAASAIRAGVRSLPIFGNAIAQGLSENQ